MTHPEKQPQTNRPARDFALTEEERLRAYEALHRSEQRLALMRQEWRGQPFPSSWELIRRMRDERSDELDRR